MMTPLYTACCAVMTTLVLSTSAAPLPITVESKPALQGALLRPPQGLIPVPGNPMVVPALPAVPIPPAAPTPHHRTIIRAQKPMSIMRRRKGVVHRIRTVARARGRTPEELRKAAK